MRRGDGPILLSLFGVAIVTAIVRPPEASESTDDESREAAVVAAGSTLPKHASPEAAAACMHAAQRPPARSPQTTLVPQVTPFESLAPLHEMLGTPIVGTPTKAKVALPRDRDLAGAFSSDGRVTLVALSASWCLPCARELPELMALGTSLHAAVNARVVLVMNDEVGGPLGLEAAVDQLWASAEPTSRARPAWLEVRADPAAHWAAWAGDREGALPQTLLLDGRGALRARVAGPLEGAHAERLLALAEDIASRDAP